MKKIIILLLLLPFFQSFAQKEIDFRINLEEGACFNVQSTILSQETVSSGRGIQESNSEFITAIQYHVLKKTADYYYLNFMYIDIYSTMGVKGGLVINPKTADPLNILDVSTQISMMMNKPFFAELSPKGKILAVKNNKEIEKEFKTKTKKLSPALREQVYVMVNSFTADESLKIEIENWSSYIPASVVKIGDKWSVEKDSTITHYTFVGETDSTYIINGVGSGEDTKTNDMQGIVIIMKMEQEFTVTIEIDKHTFLPKIITKEIEMTVQNEIQGYPDLARDPSRSQSAFTLKINTCN